MKENSRHIHVKKIIGRAVIAFIIIIALLLTFARGEREGDAAKIVARSSGETPGVAPSRARSDFADARIAPAISTQSGQQAVSTHDARAIRGEKNFARRDFRFLLRRLGLNAADEEQFLELMAKTRLLVVERRDGLISKRFATPDEANEFYATEYIRIDNEVKALLGANYNAYDAAVKQIPVVRMVDGFLRQMGKHSEYATDEVAEKLVELTFAEYQRAGVNLGYNSRFAENIEPMSFAADIMARQRANGQVRAKVIELLPAEALATFERYQSSQLRGLIDRVERNARQRAQERS